MQYIFKLSAYPIFASEAIVASNYKRLLRFIRAFVWPDNSIWSLVSHVFSLPDKVWLTIDRTNWKFGKVAINFFVIGIAYKGISIPILWTLLESSGNSHCDDRIKMMSRLLVFFPKSRIAGLLGDREFVGKVWFDYLLKEKIHFVLRTRENINIGNTRGILLPAKLFFRNIKPGKSIVLPGKRKTMGCELYVSVLRKEDGELLILLTDSEPENALENYAIRWEIEMLFSCLKTRGFNFENTHLTEHDRLSNLMFVLTLAFIFSYRQGEICIEEKPLKIKKHGHPVQSIFRVGLDAIANHIFKIGKSARALCQMIFNVFKKPKKKRTTQNSAGGVQ